MDSILQKQDDDESNQLKVESIDPIIITKLPDKRSICIDGDNAKE